MRLKMEIGIFILILAPGWGFSDDWQVLRQETSQTLLASPNGVIYIEPGSQLVFSDSAEIYLQELGQSIYPDGQLQRVDSLQQLAPNLVGQNFLVLRNCYLPPETDKLRVIVYADSLLSVKFFATTRNQDFQFLETNLDYLAQQFQAKLKTDIRKISESVTEPE
jgi:hypothetical protein